MKVAIVVGHNPRQPGAVRCDTREAEYLWNSRIAMRIEETAAGGDYPGIEVKTFFRPYMGSYAREVRDVYPRVDAFGADVSLELHFNSHENPKANGCEMLSSGSARSMQLSEALQNAVLSRFEVRDRGVKVLGPKDDGYLALHAGRAPAVILEPYFGSNAKDCATFSGPHDEQGYAEAILDAVEAIGQEWGLLGIQAANAPAQKVDVSSFWSAVLQFLKGWKR